MKKIESNTRLQMIACLSIANLTYDELINICQCSDDEMADHIKQLIDDGLISIERCSVNDEMRTIYSLTQKGNEEFAEYFALLKSLINTKNKF